MRPPSEWEESCMTEDMPVCSSTLKVGGLQGAAGMCDGSEYFCRVHDDLRAPMQVSFHQPLGAIYLMRGACEFVSARTHSTYTRAHRGQQHASVYTQVTAARSASHRHCRPHAHRNSNALTRRRTRRNAYARARTRMILFLLTRLPGPKSSRRASAARRHASQQHWKRRG